jgi:hypothetical protein
MGKLLVKQKPLSKLCAFSKTYLIGGLDLASLRMDPHDVIVFDDRKHVNATALC